jgi:hypothetical protein
MPRRKLPLTQEIIDEIRKKVRDGAFRTQVARELDIPYKRVLNCTKDLPMKRGIPEELRQKIRQEVLSGKSKRRVSIELGLNEATVVRYTKDICLTPFRKINIQDKKLLLMQDLLRDGYAFPSEKYGIPEYIKLKEHFPTINKVMIHAKVIFFLEGKEDITVRMFLENERKKIISYQDLKEVTKIFHADLSSKEKQVFLLKNKERKLFRNKGVQKERSLREKDDSFSYFCIRSYCSFIDTF